MQRGLRARNGRHPFVVASLAFQWTLYWADRNSRWHRYDDLEPTTNLDDVLTEINEDPTCIFWG